MMSMTPETPKNTKSFVPEREFNDSKELTMISFIEEDLMNLESKLAKYINCYTDRTEETQASDTKPKIMVSTPHPMQLEELRTEKAAFLARYDKVMNNHVILRKLMRENVDFRTNCAQLLNDKSRVERENFRLKEEYQNLKDVLHPEGRESPKINNLEALMLEFANRSFGGKQKTRIEDLQMEIKAKDEEILHIKSTHSVTVAMLQKQIDELCKERCKPAKRSYKKIDTKLIKSISVPDKLSPLKPNTSTKRASKSRGRKASPSIDFSSDETDIKSEYVPEEFLKLEEVPLKKRNSKVKSASSKRDNKSQADKMSPTSAFGDLSMTDENVKIEYLPEEDLLKFGDIAIKRGVSKVKSTCSNRSSGGGKRMKKSENKKMMQANNNTISYFLSN